MTMQKNFFYAGFVMLTLFAIEAKAQMLVQSIGQENTTTNVVPSIANPATAVPTTTAAVPVNTVKTGSGTTITQNPTATAPITQIVNGKVITPLATTTAINTKGNTPAATSQPTSAQAPVKTTTTQQVQPVLTTATTNNTGTITQTATQNTAAADEAAALATEIKSEKVALKSMYDSMYAQKIRQRKARRMDLLGPQRTAKLKQGVIKSEMTAQQNIIAKKSAAAAALTAAPPVASTQ